MTSATRTRIEQAIARGHGPERIATDLGLHFGDVLAVWQAMEQAVTEDDDRPRPTEALLTWEGRPLSSYFGAADPSTIRELIDAVVPPQPPKRRRVAA